MANRQRSALVPRLVVVALVLAGVVVTLWPVGVTARNDADAAQRTRTYVEQIEQVRSQHPTPDGGAPPSDPLAEQLEQARAYNARLRPDQLKDPWSGAGGTVDARRTEYLAALSLTDAMGRLIVPRIQVDLPIHHDADKTSLMRGVGHMYGTSLPVGGPDTHAVLAGHTGMRARTYFDRLGELEQGDEFVIQVSGAELRYRVDRISTVLPTELAQIERVPGEDHVTLLTCVTPPGGKRNALRLLVRGARIPDGPTTDATTQVPRAVAVGGTPVATDFSIQAWMWPRLAVAGLALLALLGMCVGWWRADRRAARTATNSTPSEGLRQ
ncbi:class C sortase [uncultured Tessaracoccus sp.]|uniref:class C sortase n=1 Tax=uncultured Tessaracoccus sp. TaxID=905023 RepID=UPI0025FC411F|nr:class C sortase [uncultured Tessaracoccus sp.]